MKSVDDEGVRVIRDAGSTWLDGSEVGLLARMRSGLPLGSMTSDLFATAVNWPERYHTSPARANIVRALRLPAEADVLEVGAGCGAITRYLGETCARGRRAGADPRSSSSGGRLERLICRA